MSLSARDEKGFTLVEIVLVIALVVIISSIAVGRVESIAGFRLSSDLRKFTNTWEFLYNESVGRNERYRLVIDLDSQSYYVRREIPADGSVIRQVDYLSGLRTQSEQARRSEQKMSELQSLDKEFEEEDIRKSGALDKMFYRHVFGDSEGPVQLGRPLEFPSLAEPKMLSDGLTFHDVKTPRGETKDGSAYIRFSPKGASEFAVVHFHTSSGISTAFMNPSTGYVKIIEGDVDFEWRLGKVGNKSS